MKVLVTGATGFIGGNLVRSLSSVPGVEVVAQVRRGGAFPSGVRVHHADLTDPGASVSPVGVDYIIHTAGLIEGSLGALISSNLAMIRRVISFACETGAKGLISCSSVSVFGQVRSRQVMPDTDIVNPGVYGSAKRLCELELDAVANDIPSVSLRLPGVIGVGARRVFIQRVVDRFFRHEAVEAKNLSEPFNSTLHVQDLAHLCVSMFSRGFGQSGHQIYCPAASPQASLGSVLALIRRECQSRSPIVDRGEGLPCYTIQDQLLSRQFEFRPRSVLDSVSQYIKERVERNEV